jgi:TonB family protein
MKNNLNILILVTVFLMQSCSPKSKNSDEYVEEKPAAKSTSLSAADRRAKVEKERADRAEKRRIALLDRAKKALTYTDSKGKVVYNKAEVDPSFVGGDKAMMKYLRDNIVYPKDAQDNGVEGTVFVDFIVTENGTVTDAVVTDAPEENETASLRAEAIRVVTSMPRWTPGQQHGQPVQVSYSLPISFQLE